MYTKRIAALQRALGADSGILVVSPSNRLYLTGMTTSSGMVLITGKGSYLIVDSRYIEAAKSTVTDSNVILETKLADDINVLCAADGVTSLTADISAMSTAQFLRLQKELVPKLLADDSADLAIAGLRAIKSAYELESMQLAQKLTDDSFEYILNHMGEGVTEREIMIKMGLYMEAHGSENRSFDFIVISGEKTSLPHGKAGDRKVKKGDFIMLDFGFVINGYHSDCTRTVAVGRADSLQREIYDIVKEAQQRAIDLVAPGISCRKVDAAARDFITDNGYGDCFGHGLGHSLGLDVHENPRFNQTDGTMLHKNMVITVEPGIYLPGKFGVRIEDMIYITENGCFNMTGCNKDLIIL